MSSTDEATRILRVDRGVIDLFIYRKKPAKQRDNFISQHGVATSLEERMTDLAQGRDVGNAGLRKRRITTSYPTPDVEETRYDSTG